MSIAITPTMTLSTELCAGLSGEEATCRAEAALRMGDVGNRVAAFFLADIAERQAYVGMGYSTFKLYAEQRWHRAESTLRHLVTVGLALRELCVIDSYFADDLLNYSQVRALLPVVTPETQRPWADWARNKSWKTIARHAKRFDKGDLPTAPKRRRIHEPKQRIIAEANPTQYEVWRLLREKFKAMTGTSLTDLDLIVMLAQLGLQLRPDGSVPGWTQVNDTHYQLHARARRGADGKLELVTKDADGEEVDLDLRELVALVARTPRVLDTSAHTGALTTPEADVELVFDPDNHGPLVPDALRDPPTSQDLREEVLKRDGYRCRQCASKDNVTVHHRVWRSYGGTTTRQNLLSLCEPCHSLVHARLLIVLGEPEGELRFLDRAGRSLERVPARPVAFPIVGVTSAPSTPAVSDAVDLDHLPAEVDGDWWARHDHLFTWNERQGDLVLAPGSARETTARTDETSPPADDTARGEGLDALVGQSAVRDRLRTAVAAAKQRDEPLGHLLLTGSPGLGKTTLARAVAADLGAPLTALQAPHVRTPEALVRTVASLKAGEVLFLDEIHALPVRAAEVLYQALDTGVMTLSVRDRDRSRVRTLRLRLQPFTLIGATTDLEQLPRPLLSRLREHRLQTYTEDELILLLDRAALTRELTLTPEGARRLALASRDTPRRALMLLDSVRNEATLAGVTVADEALVARVLAREGVDAHGLDEVERAYLRELEEAGGRPLGLRTLAMRLDVTVEALQTVHEPALVRRGLVRITSNGRVLTSRQVATPVGSDLLAEREAS